MAGARGLAPTGRQHLRALPRFAWPGAVCATLGSLNEGRFTSQSVVPSTKVGGGAGDGTRTRDIVLGKQYGPNGVAPGLGV